MFHCLHEYFISSIEPCLVYTSFDDLNITSDHTVVRKVTLYIVLYLSVGSCPVQSSTVNRVSKLCHRRVLFSSLAHLSKGYSLYT